MIVPEKGFKPEDIITGSLGRPLCRPLSAQVLDQQGKWLHPPLAFDLAAPRDFLRAHAIRNRRRDRDHQPQPNFRRANRFGLQRDQCEINPDQLKWIPDYAITMIVGEGMRTSLGVIEDVLAPLAEAHVEVPMINQGLPKSQL